MPTTTSPKVQVFRSLSGRKIRLSPAYGVRLVYKDNPQQAVANRYVLYWQYNETDDGLHRLTNDEHYWQRKGVIMPVGLGMTNEKGELIPVKRVPGLDLSNTEIEHTENHAENNNIYYRRPNYSNAQSIQEQVKYDQSRQDTDHRTVKSFTGSKAVAFMLLPVDNLHLSRYRSEDLITLGKNSPMVWKGKLTEDQQTIEMPCPLGEWDVRLQNQIRPLEAAIERYQNIIAPHLQEIAKLENLRHYQQILYRYPMDKAQRDKQGNEILINRIKDLQQTIAEQYVSNTDNNTPSGKAQADILEQGEKLFELLSQPALVEEIKRYMPYLNDTDLEEKGKKTSWPSWDRKPNKRATGGKYTQH